MRYSKYIITFLILLYSTTALTQTDWYDYYTNAREALEKNQWHSAIREIDNALEKKSAPQLDVEIYSLQFVDYLPYYWRGVAYYNLGDFSKAYQNFELSFSHGVILKSPFATSFERYRDVTETYLNQQKTLDSLAVSLERLQQNSTTTNATRRKLIEISDAVENGNIPAAIQTLSEIKTTSPDKTLPVLLEKLLHRLQPADSTAIAGTNLLSDTFENGLQHFLAGNYQEALNQFRLVSSRSPDYRQVNDWIRRILAEMVKEGIPPDTVKIEIQTQTTVAPVISIAPFENPTRSDTLELAGSVRDDRGIQFIEYSLNRSPFTDAAGSKVRRFPNTPEEASSFSFHIKMPLRVGENQVTVIAHDVDSPEQHTATLPLNIVRKLPLYKTPAFFISVGIVLLIILGIVIVNGVIKRRIAFVSKYNPYIAGAPVRNEKMFFGRETLVRRLINNLHNNSLMIHGPRRIGKTSLLHQLKKKLENEPDREYEYVPVYIDLQGTPENNFFSVMMHDIYESCESRFPDTLALRISENGENYSARDFSADIKKILAVLQENSKKKLKLVLLIDEVDELNSYSERVNQKLRSIFMKTFAENLVAVMSGTHIRKRWESEGSPWYNFFEEIEVSGISREFSEQLIRTPVKGIFYYDDDAVRKIIEYSDNVPYRIQKFCVNAISRVIEDRRRKVTVEDVESIKQKVLESEEKDKG